MDFGRVPEAAVNTIDFTLPEDSLFTQNTLTQSEKNSDIPLVCVGCAKWEIKEWVGKLYPKSQKKIDYLAEYVKQFNSIELNATHYKIYDAAGIQKWKDKASGRDFLFCPKVPQEISHKTALHTHKARNLTEAFLAGIAAFGKHLGPIFLQLSDSFSPARKKELFIYLRSLPENLSFFVEVRHPQWFSDKDIRHELLLTLQELNMGIVITDTSGRRDCAHMELSIPKTFIRFVGNSLHPTDYSRINGWVTRIDNWLQKGLQELYFFIHQHDETYSPELSEYTIKKLNEKVGLKLPLPRLTDPNSGLLF
jgi:uncharacterized protein YecE (DUF72 family)